MTSTWRDRNRLPRQDGVPGRRAPGSTDRSSLPWWQAAAASLRSLTMRDGRTLRVVAHAGVAALLLAGCGASGDSGDRTAQPAGAAEDATATPTGPDPS